MKLQERSQHGLAADLVTAAGCGSCCHAQTCSAEPAQLTSDHCASVMLGQRSDAGKELRCCDCRCWVLLAHTWQLRCQGHLRVKSSESWFSGKLQQEDMCSHGLPTTCAAGKVLKSSSGFRSELQLSHICLTSTDVLTLSPC